MPLLTYFEAFLISILLFGIFIVGLRTYLYRKYPTLINGTKLFMAPGMHLYIPEPGPLSINLQMVDIPEGGIFFSMSDKGELHAVLRPDFSPSSRSY